MDDLMMIEPPPARRIAGTAYFTDRNTPSRFAAVGQQHLDGPVHDPDPGIGHHNHQVPESLL
jgi:hypothetical protein